MMPIHSASLARRRLAVQWLLRRPSLRCVSGSALASTAAAGLPPDVHVVGNRAERHKVRVDNLLSQAGFCARREARQFCRRHDVFAVDPEGDEQQVLTGRTKVLPWELRVEGEAIEYAGQILHLVMHKPAGVVCTHADDEGKTVYDLLPQTFQMRKPTLSSIGRLDRMASGLLFFTQDGKLNSLLSSPQRGCRKEYVIALEEELSSTGVESAAFASGRLQLVDGSICAPAVLTPHASRRNVCKVTLTEGRHHQIRRMFAALGHQVTGIHRISFGGLTLPGLGLKEGEWRLLTADELAVLMDTSQQAPEDVRRTADGLPPLAPTKMRVRVSIQRERKQEVYAEMVREMERSVAAERAAARAAAAGSGAAAAPLR